MAGNRDQSRSPNYESKPVELPSANYRIQVMLGGVRHSVTGASKQEAREKRDDLKRRFREQRLIRTKRARRPTREFLERWLEIKRGTVEPSMWARYRYEITQRLVPTVGHIRLGDLTADDFREALLLLLKGAPPLRRKVAPRTAAYAHETLNLALKQAATDGIVARNIAADVAPPKVPKTKAWAFTAAEVERLLTSCEGDWHTLWLLALYTGMRLGELLSLPWDALVFVSRFGTFLLRSNVIRAFKRECADARPAIAGPVNPHLCRHTFASHLFAERRPITEISYVLGHSSRSVTMDIYGHFLSTEGQGTPSALARSYRGAGRRAPAVDEAAAAGDPLPAHGVGSDRQGP